MDPSLDPTGRFSDRVADYARHRPGYPPAVLDHLKQRCALADGATVADLGSGTGIFSRLLLDGGFRVRAVEPNAGMRAAGEEALGGHPRFTSCAGTAEATGLADASMDAATAAQSFHWFDPEPTREELRRILRPGGCVVLLWNARRLDGSPFLRAYENHLLRHGLGYREIDHRGLGEERFAAFYQGPFEETTFPNEQRLDFEGLRGRHFSSSYTPPVGHPGHAAALEDLRRLFEAHQERGQVVIEYDTRVIHGGLSTGGLSARDA